MERYNYNLGMLFDEIVDKHKSDIAIKYDYNNYSYFELNKKVNELVKFLLNKGLCQGDVVAIANTKKINSL